MVAQAMQDAVQEPAEEEAAQIAQVQAVQEDRAADAELAEVEVLLAPTL
jgi:hypothetical protein